MKALFTAVAALLCLLGPGSLRAQDGERPTSGAALVRSWMQSQRIALGELTGMRVEADVRHALDGGGGRREVEFHVRYRGRPVPGGMAKQLSDFRFSGQPLQPEQARQMMRRIRSTLNPELAPLIDEFVFPAELLQRFRPEESFSWEERGGHPMIRVEFQPVGGPPGGRPLGKPRPGEGPPGLRPPGGRKPPPPRKGDPLGGPPPGPPDRPPARATAWFSPDSGRLVAFEVHIDFPGRRSGRIETTFIRIGGVDVPSRLRIEGAFTVPRRLRMVTVEMDHETVFGNYDLRK